MHHSDTLALTTKVDRELLQFITKLRDELNHGMSRKEMIVLITRLFGASLYKAAENHFNYLLNAKQLNELKWGDGVVAAQAITTNCTLQSPPRNCSIHTTLLCLLGANRQNGTAGIIGFACKMRARILEDILSGRQRKTKSS